MSVDDRLRTGLRPNPEAVPEAQHELISVLVARVQRRHRIRVLAVGAAAAVACLVVALVVPQVLAGSRSDEPPVVRPTTAAPTTPPADYQLPDRTTPVDGKSWSTRLLIKQERLAVLEGTGLEEFGPKVITKAEMQSRLSQVELWFGEVTGVILNHDRGGTDLAVVGKFRVEGHDLIITLKDTRERVVFNWRKPDPDHLVLTFVSTTAGPMYGAPAEVFYRMWAATPFTLRLGY